MASCCVCQALNTCGDLSVVLTVPTLPPPPWEPSPVTVTLRGVRVLVGS